MRILKSFLVLTIAILTFTQINTLAANMSGGNDISQQVGKEIRKLPYYGVFDIISYEVDGNTVILSGRVYNAMNKKSAERRVEDIDGVENVVNNIEILPFSGFDNDIRRKTLRAFAGTGNIYGYLQGNNPSMRIIVDNGHVTLEGYVRTEGDSRLANILANGVTGVFSVTNNLVVTKENIKF
ncbi:MAG: BON domain-containing protein [Pyrinomonadaceae bacterium]